MGYFLQLYHSQVADVAVKAGAVGSEVVGVAGAVVVAVQTSPRAKQTLMQRWTHTGWAVTRARTS